MGKSATTTRGPASEVHAAQLDRYGKKYRSPAVLTVVSDSSATSGRGGAKKSGKKGPGLKLAR